MSQIRVAQFAALVLLLLTALTAQAGNRSPTKDAKANRSRLNLVSAIILADYLPASFAVDFR